MGTSVKWIVIGAFLILSLLLGVGVMFVRYIDQHAGFGGVMFIFGAIFALGFSLALLSMSNFFNHLTHRVNADTLTDVADSASQIAGAAGAPQKGLFEMIKAGIGLQKDREKNNRSQSDWPALPDNEFISGDWGPVDPQGYPQMADPSAGFAGLLSGGGPPIEPTEMEISPSFQVVGE